MAADFDNRPTEGARRGLRLDDVPLRSAQLDSVRGDPNDPPTRLTRPEDARARNAGDVEDDDRGHNPFAAVTAPLVAGRVVSRRLASRTRGDAVIQRRKSGARKFRRGRLAAAKSDGQTDGRTVALFPPSTTVPDDARSLQRRSEECGRVPCVHSMPPFSER